MIRKFCKKHKEDIYFFLWTWVTIEALYILFVLVTHGIH